MKKSLFSVCLFLICILQVEAKVLDVSYKVNFGVLGQMGITHAHLETKGNKYTIDITMKTTGLAKKLSNNRKERHISKGHIVNGIYISDSYKVIRSYGKKYIVKLYTIDHKKKKVKKEYFRKKNGKLKKRQEKILDFYSKNDLLTLYFNLHKLIKDKSKAKIYAFSAVGAEKIKGEVIVRIPKISELAEYKEVLGTGDYWYMTVIIHQELFASNKGELMLAVSKDGIAQKAVLKDLLLFGDISSERIK